jgi:hypothetical protein
MSRGDLALCALASIKRVEPQQTLNHDRADLIVDLIADIEWYSRLHNLDFDDLLVLADNKFALEVKNDET